MHHTTPSPRGRAPVVFAWLLVLLAGCGFPKPTHEEPGTGGSGGGSGGSGSAPRCSDCEGEDGGSPAPPAVDGDTVAVLRTTAPPQTRFLLRGTIPVPPRTYPRVDGRDPLVIVDWNGTPLSTQIEVVSRYPREEDGADVVELLALVSRDPARPVGADLAYDVRHLPRPAPIGAGTPGLEDLRAPENLPSGVLALLGDPGAIEIATYDCFGNRYVARPLDGTGSLKLLHHGRVESELRIHQTMRAEPFLNGPRGTLPHAFGVHAYLSTFREHGLLGLDLRFHDAHSGRDKTSPLDDPLDRLYFERIEISVPVGWTLDQDFPDPFLGGFRTVGDRRVFDLVKPNPDGRMHVIRWQGQFHRRLMLSTDAARDRAEDYLEGAGRAFATRGTDPVRGRPYWSWWNRGTARYLNQKTVLPSLAHVGLNALRAGLAIEHDRLANHLLRGTSDGDYPVDSPVLGWGHPYGVAYGGMTGGNEIFLYDGVEVAEAASVPGYQLYTALHRMHTDRQPTALFDMDGEPSSVERWLVENGANDYVPFYCFGNPQLRPGDPDPFGLAQAPRFQIQFVEQNGLQPGYEARYLEYAPHDFQHFIRYTRSAKVLAWLGNDSLAKDDLRMQGETFHLSYHDYRNDPNGGVQGSGLLAQHRFVNENPGKGCFFGRGEAWGLDCMLAAYNLSDPGWRARKRPWFRSVIEMLLEGQGTCTGFVQAFVSDKAVDGKYRARQQIEQSITENALQGLRESVFRGLDASHADMTRAVLIDSLYAFIGPMAWFPGQPGPWRYTGIGPLDVKQKIWCSRSQMPGDAWTHDDIEAYLNWSSFAYGYELTGDPIFLEFATTEIGGGDLLRRLENEGTENIANRSALLAMMQRLRSAP